jgi:hypothetical protein
MNLVGAQSIGMKGFFKMETFKGEYVYDAEGEHIYCDGMPIVHVYAGSRRIIADWFPNQILDAGRNIMADFSGWAGAGANCQVGTNSTDPSSGHTQLLGYIAGNDWVHSGARGAAGDPPYFQWNQQTYRFDEGNAEGNLSEAGVGWDGAYGPYLITRALIVDEDGEPFTPTVKDDEWLDVTYQLRYYPPLEDVEGTIVLDGITYDTITRAANVTTDGNHIGQILGVATGGTYYWRAYDGPLGPVFESPDGLSEANNYSGQFNVEYQNNSMQVDMHVDCGISGWNLDNGIRSILIMTNGGDFQTQFTAQGTGNTIPKDINYYMDFVWRLTWAGWYWGNTYNREASSDATTPTAGNWNTNLAETLLRINWDDTGATDHQEDLQLETNTLFRITQDSDTTKWIQYRGQESYVEDVDYTSYVVVVEDSQNGGPVAGQDCTITAVDY